MNHDQEGERQPPENGIDVDENGEPARLMAEPDQEVVDDDPALEGIHPLELGMGFNLRFADWTENDISTFDGENLENEEHQQPSHLILLMAGPEEIVRSCDCTCPLPFYHGEPIIRLSVCGHLFHQDCIWAWLARNGGCQLCGHPIGG